MGQTAARVQEHVQRRAAPLQEASTISLPEVYQQAASLSAACQPLQDAAGRRLRFSVDDASAAAGAALLWRGTVRVICERLTGDGAVEARRPLSLREFLQLRQTLLQQGAWLAQLSEPAVDCAADGADAAPLKPALLQLSELDADGCCCVCLERPPDTSLPCAHAYCARCVRQWSAVRRGCPVCRQTLQSVDDAWVMTDAPTEAQVREEALANLLSLAGSSRPP